MYLSGASDGASGAVAPAIGAASPACIAGPIQRTPLRR